MEIKSSSSGKIPGIKSEQTITKQENLPKEYGITKIVLLPRDPFWAFAYWELTETTKSELEERYGKDVYDKSKYLLRVYDVTDIVFDGKNAHKYFDIEINPNVDNWYINVSEPNRNWCVDLGLLLPDGRFITIVRSNTVSMPRHGVSMITDEQWGVLKKEFERLLKLSGIEFIGKGSFDIAKLMRERWEEIVSISSMRASPLGISSFRPMPEEKPEAKLKDFWLKADTELIVYGTTESDAKLTIDGEEVKLNPDGSFSLRFNLSDGVRDIHIVATSSDGKMTKTITFNVSRKTKK